MQIPTSQYLAGWAFADCLYINGLPISDAHQEVSPTDGKTYLTQWFERARFEYHPENAAPYNVLLGLLGREQLTKTPLPICRALNPSHCRRR